MAAYRWNVHAIHNGEVRLLGDFGNLPVMVEKVIRYHQGEYCIRIFCGQRIIILTIRFCKCCKSWNLRQCGHRLGYIILKGMCCCSRVLRSFMYEL